jgi:hypothetical protein
MTPHHRLLSSNILKELHSFETSAVELSGDVASCPSRTVLSDCLPYVITSIGSGSSCQQASLQVKVWLLTQSWVWFCPLYQFWDQCCVSVRVSANVVVLHLGYTCCSSHSVPDCVAYCWSSLHITFLCRIYSEIELSAINHISLYRQVLFYARDTFLKNITQIKITQTKHKVPTENITFPGG